MMEKVQKKEIVTVNAKDVNGVKLFLLLHINLHDNHFTEVIK